MRMEANLQARQEMQMKLAPQVIQSIEILQLPLLELEQRIDQELEENPLLELERSERTEVSENSESAEEDKAGDSEQSDPMQEETVEADRFERLSELTDYYEKHTGNEPFKRSPSDNERGSKLEALENSPAPEPSLQDHLRAQVSYLALEEPLQAVCENIISNLDDRGYLEHDIESLIPSSIREESSECGERALEIVQGLEPPGVGARDLKECLLLQLDPREKDYDTVAEIINNHFEDVTRNRLPRIAEKTGYSIETVKKTVEKIGSLTPRPGSLFSNPPSPHVLPDVSIYEDDGGYEVALENAWLPSLRISAYYARRLQEKGLDEKTRAYLEAKLQAAQGIISAIEQRRVTLENVVKEIVKVQKDFFDRGEMYLKPLKMQDVADAVGVHVSTVSRAISDKYAQTPQGIYSLKRFFSGGIRNKDGDLESWDVVRKKLVQLINNEDKQKPMSDEEIAETLKAHGIDIARRTVAKYRKNLDIPSSRLRREY